MKILKIVIFELVFILALSSINILNSEKKELSSFINPFEKEVLSFSNLTNEKEKFSIISFQEIENYKVKLLTKLETKREETVKSTSRGFIISSFLIAEDEIIGRFSYCNCLSDKQHATFFLIGNKTIGMKDFKWNYTISKNSLIQSGTYDKISANIIYTYDKDIDNLNITYNFVAHENLGEVEFWFKIANLSENFASNTSFWRGFKKTINFTKNTLFIFKIYHLKNDTSDYAESKISHALDALPPIVYTYSIPDPVETRYFRYDYTLGTTQSSTKGTSSASSITYYGIRVWKNSSSGVETEITSGSPVAIAQSHGYNYDEELTGTWNCPQYSLDPSDSIVVRIYSGTSSPPSTLVGTWTTGALGASQLNPTTWSVKYYHEYYEVCRNIHIKTCEEESVCTSYWRLAWGLSPYNTRIENFSYIDAQAPQYSLNSINSTLAGSAVLHSLFWQDNVGLSHAIFSFDNCTGNFQNISTIQLTGKQAWSNFTVVINDTVNCEIKWKVYANDTSNNSNESEIFSYVTFFPTITVISPENTTYNTSFFWANISLNTPGSVALYSLDNQPNQSLIKFNDTYFYKKVYSKKGNHRIVFYANDTQGIMINSSEIYFYLNVTGYTTIELSIKKAWWNDPILVYGQVKDWEERGIDSMVKVMTEEMACENYTDSNGNWFCKLSAPREIGNYLLSIDAGGIKNFTYLKVSPFYGKEEKNVEKRVYETPVLIQDKNGKIKIVQLRFTSY